MRATITRNMSEDGLRCEQWTFDYADQGLRLTGLRHVERKTKRHKWQAVRKWDHIDERSYHSNMERPRVIPLDVLRAAQEEMCRQIMEAPAFIGWFRYQNQVR